MSRVLNVILSHQSKAEVQRLVDWWSSYVPIENVLLAYGGSEEEFNRLVGCFTRFYFRPAFEG